VPLQVSAVPGPDVARHFVRDSLNERYNQGHATNDLTKAGVLIHNFDGHLDYSSPWVTRSGGWMQDYSYILSSSLLNDRKAGSFSRNGGVVLSPLSGVLCSYPYDGGAMNYLNGCGPTYCSEPDNVWGCAFPPSMTYRMMEIHENGDQWPYNEVVIDASAMIFEAVFWGREGPDASEIHARVLAHFGLNERQLPLLTFRPGHWDPFS
jgi:hypothetical protein